MYQKINQLKLSITDKFLFFIFIFITARASWIIGEDWFILIVFIITFFLFIQNKNRMDSIIFIIILFWIIINTASGLYNKTTFEVNSFIGEILKILTAYFILKIIGNKFFQKLENLIYKLAIISLPIFTLQLLFPQFFTYLATFLGGIVLKEQQDVNGWYIFIYMHSGFGDYYRNSGFMWEPGAFALMIILGVLLHLYYTDFKPNLARLLIYLITLATTLSTMGYIVVFIVFFIFIIKKKRFSYSVILLPLILLLWILIADLDFILPEIEKHQELSYYMESHSYSRSYYLNKLNRLGFVTIAVQDSFNWPFGNGVFVSKKIQDFYGSNIIGGSTFGSLLLEWGWIGIAFWIYSIILFFRKISDRKNSVIVDIMAAIVIILAFSSNPMSKSPLLYIIILFSLIKFSNKLEYKYV